VNNWVTNCIDWLGRSIYELSDADAVGGFGHSAQIATVRNSNGTYSATYYDYGMISGCSTGCNTGTVVSETNDGAIAAAIQTLDPTGGTYDSMSAWLTDDTNTQAAITAMNNFVNESYVPGDHNCRSNLNAGLSAAGFEAGTDYSSKNTPSTAHTEDMGLGVLDCTKALKQVQNSYKE
jgi:hypothetical protein